MKSKWEKWEQTRAKGKKNYVIFNGLLGWGIPMALLYTAVWTYIQHQEIAFNQELYQTLIISLVIFSVAGVGFGIWTWNTTEKQYQKYKGNNE
ncbi:hypothetical protein D3P09_22070 [Paenibacillus pinisoli]|uniref:Uncharacterized protein n=1 Tax=Paenibacillus pinisoli TaxID=1276110 RepID=A0A3A6P9N6_9BACL|nr:hypothetical protein [Paenibacillus pinisoli]RJX37662.1 hypothetical protein D3P09_22070 [Paenibacillus pinisoli]